MALKEEYAGEVVFIVADLDNPLSGKLVEKYSALFIPAFFFINSSGEVMAEESGFLQKDYLEQRLALIVGDSVANGEKPWLEIFFTETLPDNIGSRSALTLLIVFIGGIITSISPCILSMVPILVGYIGGYDHSAKSRGFFLSLLFVVGLSLTFSFLGFLAASFGRVFGEVGQVWYYVLAAVALIMGLQLLGVLTFELPGLKKISPRRQGLGGSLIMGLLFGLVASPCATPVLAVIITYAAVQAEPLYGSGLLFIYGLGHGLPLLVAGTFTGMAKKLPGINKYTAYLSYISGSILLIAGLALIAWVNW